MTEAKFSKGEWRRDLLRATRVVTDGERLVCECLPSRTVATVPGLAEALANARAIAALPRLIQACQKAYVVFGTPSSRETCEVMNELAAALALALGDS